MLSAVPRWPALVGLALLSIMSAQAQSFHDDFETDQDWFFFEEIVGSNSCYGSGIGSQTRSTEQSLSSAHSLRLWSNQSGSLLANHVSAVQRVAYAGRTGKWRYTVNAFIDSSYPVYQT